MFKYGVKWKLIFLTYWSSPMLWNWILSECFFCENSKEVKRLYLSQISSLLLLLVFPVIWAGSPSNLSFSKFFCIWDEFYLCLKERKAFLICLGKLLHTWVKSNEILIWGCQKMALTNTSCTNCLFHGHTMRSYLSLNGGKILVT